jgi:cell pole-organizing protein PopZ
MGKAEPAQTQSVEQILASIRNAISDDETRRGFRRPGNGAVPQSADPEPSETDADDPETQGVINLAIEKAIDGVRAELAVDAEEPEAAGNGQARTEADGRRPAGVSGRSQSRFQPASGRTDGRPLLSARAGAAVSASFDSLARSVAPANGRKLEEIVEGMLRPMLRSWLDDNLPLLVERLVREEIERVSRSGR